jgi:hypothetical protein
MNALLKYSYQGKLEFFLLKLLVMTGKEDTLEFQLIASLGGRAPTLKKKKKQKRKTHSPLSPLKLLLAGNFILRLVTLYFMSSSQLFLTVWSNLISNPSLMTSYSLPLICA